MFSAVYIATPVMVWPRGFAAVSKAARGFMVLSLLVLIVDGFRGIHMERITIEEHGTIC
jgi:hypothetical protein